MKKSLSIVAGLSFLAVSNSFGIVWQSDGTVQSVQYIHNYQAANGDTITIPSGTFTWATGLNITKAVTIQGAGIGQTIIKDSVLTGSLINITTVAGYNSRLTGIEFQNGARTTVITAPVGVLHVNGSNTNGSTFRWDHCKWKDMKGASVFQTVIGVIDHNVFITTVRPGAEFEIVPYAFTWNNDTGGTGDRSWASPVNYGSGEFLFIEDNVFDDESGTTPAMTDAYGGARFVFRYNTIIGSGSPQIDNHGTESTGRARGARALEIYNNTFDCSTNGVNRFIGGIRSGGLLFHDNRVLNGYWGDLATCSTTNFRSFHAFSVWGGADGINPWDQNDPTIYFSGTATSGANHTVTLSGAHWTPNQWAGYTIRRTSDICNSGSIPFDWIVSNTTDTITFVGNAVYGGDIQTSFCAGDTFQIRKVNIQLDQPGAGICPIISGANPTPPPGWTQAVEPVYSWNNINSLGHLFNVYGGIGVRLEFVHQNEAMPGYTPYIYPHPLTVD